jgi:Respiratory-chain NADH dehydrogenase, 30 Kd subunit
VEGNQRRGQAQPARRTRQPALVCLVLHSPKLTITRNHTRVHLRTCATADNMVNYPRMLSDATSEAKTENGIPSNPANSPARSFSILPKSGDEKEGVLLEVSMGPQHPSTHGVFCMDVVLDGHPDLRRILMWDEFKDFPMRKDYVEPDDCEYEPMPHDEVLKKAKQHQAQEVKA